MDEISETVKSFLGKVKDLAKTHLKIIIIVASIIIIFGVSIYVVMKETVKTVIKAAQEFTSIINIGDDGTMSTNISAQALWNKMIQQGYEVDKYLDNPSELSKLLQAELVTKLPDTRSNVEEPIDWDKMFDASKYVNNNVNNNNKSENEKGENIQGIIKFLRHDENGKQKYLTYASPTEFDSWIDEYKNSGSQTAKENALSHFTLKKTQKSKRNIEITSTGIEAVIEAAKSQLGEPYSTNSSEADPGGHGFNCSGLVWWAFEQAGYSVDHAQCAYGCEAPNRGMIDTVYANCGRLLNESEVKRGDVLFYDGSSENRESGHVAIYLGNGERIHSGGVGVGVVIDSNAFNSDFIGGGPLIQDSGTTAQTTAQTTTQTTTQPTSNEDDNSYSSYQAIVATWTQIDKSTETFNSPHANEACDAFGITYENNTTYTMTTKPIDYESMVEPYTLSFDLLWTFLVIGQSKNFVMDWADLAYGSDIVISIYDNLTTTTDIDDWYYKEETDVKVSGLVDYHIEGGNSHYRHVDHEHIYANGDTSVKQEDGHIKKTVVKNQNTLITELTKAHTWIADYDATYTYSNDGEKTQTGENSRDNYNLIPYTKGSIADDPCGEIQEKIEEIVYDVNAEYQQIANQQSQQMMSELYDTLGDLGGRTVQTVAAKSISGADVNTSGVDVYTQVNHVDIIDKTINTTITRKYIAGTPSLKIKDGEASSTTININSSNTSSIVGNTIEEKVWWALQNAGYSKEVTAGAMGNIYAESGFNPGSTENGLSYDEVMNNNNLGLGICGWTFPDLKKEFIDFAKSRGKPWTNEDIQVEFLVACMTPGGVQGITSRQWANPTHGCSYEDFKNAATPEDAAYQYCWVFENPAESEAHMDTRQAKAREYYEKYIDYKRPASNNITSLDNFLFIGDSRYAEGGYINSEIQAAGNNIKIAGVGSSSIEEWLNVANNGGRGTVQGTDVNITGNYSGISIQLGANSVLNNVTNATSQMQSFINKLKELHPNTPIFVNSCLGVNANAKEGEYTWNVANMQNSINQFNSNIKQLCNTIDSAYYIDISIGLMDANGFVKLDYENDGLHMTSIEGARIFVDNIKNGVQKPGSASKLSKKQQKSALVSDNFVSLFNKEKYRDNKNNILSATELLFEIMQENDKLSNMVEIMKYLLYRATGTNYGATDIEQIWKEYTDSFKSVQSSGGSSGITGVPGQVYDFLLSKGVPPVGAAAVMGNIENESGFRPDAVNEIGCSGLCQWYAGRLENLKNYAASKGTEWTDVNTQMEFLWKELEESYTGVKDVIMSAKSESDLEYATWYWGSHFEVYDLAQDVGFETSKNWTEEKERYEASNKWYSEWQTHHTSGGSIVAGGITTDIEMQALTETFNQMLNTQVHYRDYAYQDGPFPSYWNTYLQPFQCTWWANGRASMYLDQNGTKYKAYPTQMGDGGQFYEVNIEGGWFNYGSTPKPNSIISWSLNDDAGHVAYVEGVTSDGIYISHAGSGKSWFGVQKITLDGSLESIWPGTGYTLNGYIYLDEPR